MRRVGVCVHIHVCIVTGDLVGCFDHAQLAQALAFVWRSSESLSDVLVVDPPRRSGWCDLQVARASEGGQCDCKNLHSQHM